MKYFDLFPTILATYTMFCDHDLRNKLLLFSIIAFNMMELACGYTFYKQIICSN